MNDSELINILDEDSKVVGKVDRAKAEDDNRITENALIFLFDAKNRVWVQLRPKTKKHYPGLWDISACGGLMHDETPEQAAARETHEETGGLHPTLHHVETFINVMDNHQGEEFRRISHLYIGITDKTPLPNDEVDEFKLWETAKLRARLVSHPKEFVPSFLIEFDKALAAYKKLI